MNHATPRKILLAVTGISPQIVTETLYALGCEAKENPDAFIPTEVHLITTQTGKTIAVENLLEKGQFQALLKDYPQLGQPLFGEDCIHVIQDARGRLLDDISTDEENTWAADSITRLMAELTRDENAILHVSMSGGRKTMGFYVGYAFSLFARPADELSHVLVSSPFESEREFYFPPAKPRMLSIRNGTQANTKDAVITLARIPIVRLRHGLPEKLLQGQASYSDTVAAIQKSMDAPTLIIRLRQKEVICGSQKIKLPPLELAWLIWWAKLALDYRSVRRSDLAEYKELRDLFLDIYKRVLQIDDERKFRNFLIELRNRDDYQEKSNIFDIFNRIDNDMEEDEKKTIERYFDDGKTKMIKKLRKQIGLMKVADQYIPKKQKEGDYYTYKIDILPENITLDLD